MGTQSLNQSHRKKTLTPITNTALLALGIVKYSKGIGRKRFPSEMKTLFVCVAFAILLSLNIIQCEGQDCKATNEACKVLQALKDYKEGLEPGQDADPDMV